MNATKPLLALALVSSLGSCAGPNAYNASVEADGPLYYISDGVEYVIFNDKAAKIFCETRAKTGSNITRHNCYTRGEVVARHEEDARELERWDMRCPSPSLCKNGQ